MSFNLVDLVKDQVKGQLIGHMGNLLGNEGGKATGAMDSMIPALLSGITGTASTNQGASMLFGAVQNQDDALLDNMGEMISGGQASTVIESGNSILSDLFGSGGLGKLAGALSSHSDVSKGGTSSLMGMLAPILLGVIKRKVMSEGMNASGLSSLLSSQISNIDAAMPQGLSDQLRTSGFLSSLGGASSGLGASASASASAGASAGAGAGAANLSGGAKDAVNTAATGVSGADNSARDAVAGVSAAVDNARDGVSSAVGGAADSVRDSVADASSTVANGANKGGSMFRWLLPLAILAGLAWAAFTYLVPGAEDAATDAASKLGDEAASLTDSASDAAATATDAVSDTATAALDATTDATTDATAVVSDAATTATDTATAAIEAASPAEVGDQLTSLFSTATETLSGITDLESAQVAVPALNDLSDKVDSVSTMFANVPAAARGPLSKIAEQGLGSLGPVVEKLNAIPGIGKIVDPILSPMLEKLQELAG